MAELLQNAGYQDFTLETLRTPDGITKLNGILRQLAQNISSDGESVRIYQGYGTPEASVAAGVGSLYMRIDGGTDTSVYRKESGSGNTGWVATKAPATLPLSVANGGTGSDLSSTAQGYLLYFSATGILSVLAPSTAGLALLTNGAGANPSWGNPNTFKLISKTTLSTAATTGDIAISNTNYYKVTFNLDVLSASDTLSIRFNADTGSNYKYSFDGRTSGGAITGGSASASAILASTAIASSGAVGVHGYFYIFPQIGAALVVQIVGELVYVDNAGSLFTRLSIGGYWNNSAAATAFSMFLTGGATVTGTVNLYQLLQS